ncbi:MAG: adenylate/guanylate cyclase domain-containing protein [Geminicoccaceae bacterium]
MDVADWLKSLGLEQHARAFADNEVDAELLRSLTADDLKELGVVAVGHRRRLLDAIAALGTPLATDHAAAVASDGERRQVSVLFADLTGFTSLSSELDAEAVHTLLDAFFQRADSLVIEHGGHVDKHIGDCVMGVFGAPVSHGHDAAHAVAAAIAIRDAMPELAAAVGRPLAVHIGVAGGQVVASGTGSAAHRAYTVTGDTVNLASRLTEAAAPGEILISHSVRTAVGARLEVADVGPLGVKGLAAPVRAWRVVGLRAPTVVDRPLAGRRGELSQFRSLIATVTGTGSGQTVLLRGEAGIGKTRLVEEVQQLAAGEGMTCHATWALDFGGATGRDPIRTLLRSLLGPDGEADPATAAARLVDEGLIRGEDRVFLNDLLELPQPTAFRATYEAMDNARRNQGKRAVMARLVEALCRSQPRLITVEDVHWADRITLAHLARLAARAGGCPCLLLLTTRLDGDPIDRGWRAEAEGAPLTTIDLGPLRPEDALVMARSIVTSVSGFDERCIERAGGNPLFLEQLVRLGQETGADAAVPGTVQSLVQARLDRLEAGDRTALQAAAVLGQRFDRGALGHLLDDPGYDPVRLAERLLLRTDEGDAFRFAHALVRDAVYDSLLTPRRRELHRRAALWFGDRDLRLHAEHLDRAEAPEAAAAYLQAARAQLAEHRTESARQLLERGLSVAREAQDRYALSCQLGTTCLDLGATQDAAAAFATALELAADDAGRCEAWLGQAACRRMAEDGAGAEAALALAEQAATRLGLRDVLARAHFIHGNLCFPRGDIEGCLRHHGESLSHARACASAQHEAAALGGLGDADYVRGRMISAQGHFERCLELCRAHGLGRIEAAHRQMLGLTRFFCNDVAGALADARASAEAARHIGQPRGEMVANMIAAEMCANLMRLDDAMAHLHEVERLIGLLGAARFEPLRLNCLAKTLRAMGRAAEALPLLRRSVEASRATSLTFTGPSSLGALALTTDDPDERHRAIAEGESLLQAGSVAHNHFRFYRDTIEATLEAGEWAEAQRLAEALAAFAAAEPLPWTTFYAARGQALAAWGQGEHDTALQARLADLARTARTAGLLLALPALEAAMVG